MINFTGRQELRPHSRLAPWLLLWVGCGLTVIGFVLNDMWHSVPWSPVATLAKLASLSLLLAWAVRRVTGHPLATSAAIVWLLALIYYAGFSSASALVLLALAAMAVGSLVIPAGWNSRVPLAALTGLALISGVAGWLLPFPVHSRAVYLVLLLALVFLRWRTLAEMLRPLASDWQGAVGAAPATAWLAITIAGVVSTCAWIPTIHFDDLAYHQGLPSQLVSLGYYQMSAGSSLWAVAAWAADVLQAITWLVAGQDSRGVLDAFWLILTLVLIWNLCEALELPPWARWMAVTLYASLPMTAGALTGMQTEGPTSALAAGIALLIQRSSKPDRRQLMAFALLFGLLLALKVSNLMIAGPLGLWLLCRWRGRLPWRALPPALLLLLLVAGSSYVYAWALTGNPVLPVFNAFFHSRYYSPTNFHDDHWDAGFRWNILWNLVFHTSRYVEGGDGSAGFLLIALGGSLLVALFDRRARSLALVGLGAFILPLTQIQYLRYAHQAFVLLIPAMLCGMPRLVAGAHRARAVATVLVVLTVVNVMFVSAGDWQLQSSVLRKFLTETRQDFMDQYAPIHRMINLVNDRYGKNARVLVTSVATPFAAGFAGKAFVVAWYDHELAFMAIRADRDPSGTTWANLLDRTGANLLILQNGQVSPGLAAAVQASHGTLVYQDGGLQLWEIRRHVLTGISQSGAGGAVNVRFDTSTLPAGATLTQAQLVLHCVPQDVPIAVSWTMGGQSGESWSHSAWINCLQDGTAHAAMDVAMQQPISSLVASARPVKPADMGLALISSELDVRRDLGAERDLAKKMRQDLPQALANWLDPWRGRSVVHAGIPMPSPADTVNVKFDAEAVPQRAAFVHANLTFECRDREVPIVVEWRIVEKRGTTQSRYQWARCGADGLARATVDAKTASRITSFTVNAAPAQPVDMGLKLASAGAAYLPNTGIEGIFIRKRIKLSKSLAPDIKIHGSAL